MAHLCRHHHGIACRQQQPALLQDLPPRSYSGDDTVAWLKDALLTLRLEGAAADVAAVGEAVLFVVTKSATACSA
jgi:hypothetical protein